MKTKKMMVIVMTTIGMLVVVVTVVVEVVVKMMMMMMMRVMMTTKTTTTITKGKKARSVHSLWFSLSSSFTTPYFRICHNVVVVVDMIWITAMMRRTRRMRTMRMRMMI